MAGTSVYQGKNLSVENQNWQQEMLLQSTFTGGSDFRKDKIRTKHNHNKNPSHIKAIPARKHSRRTDPYISDSSPIKKIRTDNPRFMEILDDIQIRFIINLPIQELSSVDRLFFQLEQAWWFYEDFIADANPRMPRFTLKAFAKLLFHHCPLLSPLTSQYNELFESFKSWKGQIPVAGCILLNKSRTQIILVQNWKKNGRSLPRGKVNEAEPPIAAAIREVLEETGFDASELVNSKHCISTYQNGQQSTMFIVPNVPEDFPFSPRVRKEISAVEWFPLDSLPDNTYGVEPILKRLTRWLKREKRMQVKLFKTRSMQQSPRTSSSLRTDGNPGPNTLSQENVLLQSVSTSQSQDIESESEIEEMSHLTNVNLNLNASTEDIFQQDLQEISYDKKDMNLIDEGGAYSFSNTSSEVHQISHMHTDSKKVNNLNFWKENDSNLDETRKIHQLLNIEPSSDSFNRQENRMLGVNAKHLKTLTEQSGPIKNAEKCRTDVEKGQLIRQMLNLNVNQSPGKIDELGANSNHCDDMHCSTSTLKQSLIDVLQQNRSMLHKEDASPNHLRQFPLNATRLGRNSGINNKEQDISFQIQQKCNITSKNLHAKEGIQTDNANHLRRLGNTVANPNNRNDSRKMDELTEIRQILKIGKNNSMLLNENKISEMNNLENMETVFVDTHRISPNELEEGNAFQQNCIEEKSNSKLDNTVVNVNPRNANHLRQNAMSSIRGINVPRILDLPLGKQDTVNHLRRLPINWPNSHVVRPANVVSCEGENGLNTFELDKTLVNKGNHESVESLQSVTKGHLEANNWPIGNGLNEDNLFAFTFNVEEIMAAMTPKSV